ncbi:DsrE family protein [Candidatus Igneacidithiobacillus taiwanensis]|uniref:DsrE family protein n=1 Tax=Candidatus Igneacidithiobacillus taiwanensis TaxID=1945924 RepID=UPI0028979B6B|nr:DsrE family protein [Candidatus Igneacidithiobacillus taiwanensis]
MSTQMQNEEKIHWTVMIRSAPGSEGAPVLHALRTAIAALADEIAVSVFFVEEAVAVLRQEASVTHPVHQDLLAEIRELQGEILAIVQPGSNPGPFLPGVKIGNMATLVRSMKASDQVISF